MTTRAAVGASETGTVSYRERVRAAFAPFADQVADWESAGHLPRALFAALGAAGVFHDRWHGGAKAGLPLAREMLTELSPLNGGMALAVSIHSEVFIHALARFGGPAHRGVLDRAIAGDVIGCAAFTEPTGGSDLPGLRSAATRTDSGWRLAGAKRYTTNAGSATHLLTLARTGRGERELTLFLVPLDHPGVQVTRFFETLGVRSADTAAIEFDLELAHDQAVGRPGGGLMYGLKLLDYERVAAATGLVSSARAALRLATAYMREREQFGKRLLDHQALAHRLADRWADTEAVAALVNEACRSGRGDELPHDLVAAAKLVAARTSTAAIDEAIQFLGGRGYTEEYPLARMYRDARLTRIGGGTDEMLRQIIATCLDVPDPAADSILNDCRARAGDGVAPKPQHHP